MNRRSFLPVFLSFLLLSASASAQTNFVINVLDGPGEGFNDPAPFTPVGGNSATTLGEARLNALQAAADIWAQVLYSPVDINIDASFDPLFCNGGAATLGAAGNTSVHSDFASTAPYAPPVPGIWYPSALANATANNDLQPAGAEISATFNSDVGTPACAAFDFYYGLDANPGGSSDFVSISLHELGHGLGFITFVDVATGAVFNGRNDTFMRYLEDHQSGTLWSTMSNAERLASATDDPDLHWIGSSLLTGATALPLSSGFPGGHVRMHAPSTLAVGSSVAHFSTAASPDQLMEPQYTGANHDPSLAADLMEDIGWVLCDSDRDGFNSTLCGGLDCDDNDATLRPGVSEACDAVDNNCDGIIDNGFDGDGDGVTTCGADGLAGSLDDDCNDGNADVYPTNTELCDSIDNNCNGLVDEGLINDLDSDGFTICDGDCDDTDPNRYPGNAELCDGVDNDCAGSPAVPVNENDGDGDGVRICGGDCDDGNAQVHSGRAEVCSNGVDDNCDGLVDNDVDDDGDGVGTCDDCDDTNSGVYPGAPEGCDGLDNDCDGLPDAVEIDSDGDGYAPCDGDCDESTAIVNPGMEEQCDGFDNNCDGLLGEGEDTDMDDDGWPLCFDCNDSNDAIHPNNEEICDGLDNDCSGSPGDFELDDADDDGFVCCDDCDDGAKTTFPGAVDSRCDDVDSDCDGSLSDGVDLCSEGLGCLLSMAEVEQVERVDHSLFWLLVPVWLGLRRRWINA